MVLFLQIHLKIYNYQKNCTSNISIALDSTVQTTVPDRISTSHKIISLDNEVNKKSLDPKINFDTIDNANAYY